jgi:hypothetical protein
LQLSTFENYNFQIQLEKLEFRTSQIQTFNLGKFELSILKIISLTKLLRCELERLNKATSRHIHLVPACHVFESTFKNQASMALEEASSQIQDQASTALEEITSSIQDQASTIFESNPVQE